MNKEFENSNEVFVLYEYATGRVHEADAYEACSASGIRVYYRSFRAFLYENAWSLAESFELVW